MSLHDELVRWLTRIAQSIEQGTLVVQADATALRAAGNLLANATGADHVDLVKRLDRAAAAIKRRDQLLQVDADAVRRASFIIAEAVQAPMAQAMAPLPGGATYVEDGKPGQSLFIAQLADGGDPAAWEQHFDALVLRLTARGALIGDEPERFGFLVRRGVQLMQRARG